MAVCGADSIPALVDGQMKGNIDALNNDGPLVLKLASETPYKDSLPERKIHVSGRVGLMATKKVSKADLKWFLFKPYRYFVEPKSIHKGKVYHILQLHHFSKLPQNKITEITGATSAAVSKAIQNYEKGKTMDVNKFIGVKLEGDEQLASCFGAIFADQEQQSATSTTSTTKTTTTNEKDE